MNRSSADEESKKGHFGPWAARADPELFKSLLLVFLDHHHSPLVPQHHPPPPPPALKELHPVSELNFTVHSDCWAAEMLRPFPLRCSLFAGASGPSEQQRVVWAAVWAFILCQPAVTSPLRGDAPALSHCIEVGVGGVW